MKTHKQKIATHFYATNRKVHVVHNGVSYAVALENKVQPEWEIVATFDNLCDAFSRVIELEEKI